MSGEFDKPRDFLSEHEPQLRQFIDLVHGQLDHASVEQTNDGRLNLPINDDNLYAAWWPSAVPALPEYLQSLLPFEPNEQVRIDARYWYGLHASRIIIWMRQTEGGPKSFNLGLRINPVTGEVDKENGNQAGSDATRNIRIGESDTKLFMDAIFSDNKDYQAAGANLDIASLFKLGIATQVDYGARQYTNEKAEKIFMVRSRTQNVNYTNGFDLSATVANRAHLHDGPSRTYVKLRQRFEPIDYSPTGVFGGLFTREIIIEQDKDSKLTMAKRNSEIALFNEPIFEEGSDGQRFRVIANVDDLEMPAELAAKLYPDDKPTMEDIDFFKRLITQPISEEDLRI